MSEIKKSWPWKIKWKLVKLLSRAKLLLPKLTIREKLCYRKTRCKSPTTTRYDHKLHKSSIWRTITNFFYVLQATYQENQWLANAYWVSTSKVPTIRRKGQSKATHCSLCWNRQKRKIKGRPTSQVVRSKLKRKCFRVVYWFRVESHW